MHVTWSSPYKANLSHCKMGILHRGIHGLFSHIVALH